MNKILLIDLERSGGTPSTINLINSIKSNYPSNDISLLVYKDKGPEHVATYLSGISKVYQINCKKIISIKSSPLFSDNFALNEFMAPLREIKQSQWDYIVNVSNDSVSTPLTSYLMEQKCRHIGACQSKDHTILYSNYWAKIYDTIVPIAYDGLSCLSSTETLLRMARLSWRPSRPFSLGHQQEDREGAKEILAIRQRSPDVKLVGVISLHTEENETCRNFLQACVQSDDFCPLLLISPSRAERELANKLREFLNGKLAIIEYELKTLPYLLLHIDLLVTSDARAKAMGDSTETPVVEICPEGEVAFRQTTAMEGNIIINAIGRRGIPINAIDILKACLLLSGIRSAHPTFSENITVHKVVHNEGRCEYFPIGGHFDVDGELTRLIAKDLIYFYAKQGHRPLFKSCYQKIFDSREIKCWVNRENENMSMASKALLSCLRSINQIKLQTISDHSVFIKDLDNLLGFCYKKSVVALPIILFRANIESIDTEDYQSNIDRMEKELFLLKGNLQKLLKFIGSIMEMEREKALSL